MARKIYWLATLLVVTACDRADTNPGAAPPPPVAAAAADARPAIVFLGTSLTAGLGVGTTEAFPALIQERLDSAGIPLRVINAGVSGETSAGGLRRLDWLLRDSIAVLVLELGANDGLRGLGSEQLAANLDSIVARTRAAYPRARILLAGMEAPPDLGPRYTAAFRATFVDVARRNGIARIPFLLSGVAGEPRLNQEDGIHPTAEGHERIAAIVWTSLEPLVRAVMEDRTRDR